MISVPAVDRLYTIRCGNLTLLFFVVLFRLSTSDRSLGSGIPQLTIVHGESHVQLPNLNALAP